MARTVLPWALMLSLLPLFAYAGCMPGQDINARANVTFCEQTQINTGACISYIDTAGNPGQESPSAPASVLVEGSGASVASGPAVTFVAPDPGARIYFTSTRSFYRGASLVGKCVKLMGRFRTVGGTYYLNDGGVFLALDPITGVKTKTPTPVALRVDLLSSLPREGDTVTIQGVCRREADGSPSLLPLSDSAIARIR